MRWRAVLVLAAAAAAALAQSPESPPVPRPDVSALDPGVRVPLEEAAAAVAAARAATDASPREVAEAYGRLGLLYYVSELRGPAAAALENALRLDPNDFRWPYGLGLVRRLEGDSSGARRQLEPAAALEPDYAPLQLRLGEVLYDLGETEAAEERFREALRLEPNLAAAEAGLGRIAYDRGQAAAAADRFQRALALQPTATSLHHQLGLAYRALGEREKAREELAANRGGRVRVPDPVIDEAAARLDSSQLHFSAGVDLMRRDQPELAVAQFERALEGRPDDPFLAYNLALAHLKLGDQPAAERWLRSAVELEPDFRDARVSLGELLAASGRLDEATEHFRRAHEIDPNDASAQVAWAKALAALGDRERALAELADVLAADPENPEALLNRGIVEAQLGREPAAEASFRGAAAAGSAAASAELGLLHERQGRLAEAEADYRAALALDPGEPEAGERLARLLGRAGRFREAAAVFAGVVAAAPDRVEARLGEALALLLADDTAAAVRTLEEGTARQPDAVALTHLLARVLATSPDAAVRDGQRALALAEEVLRREATVDHAETVAMALAELGRMPEAVAWQERALGQLAAADPGRLAAARARLESYRRGEPVRAPWRGAP